MGAGLTGGDRLTALMSDHGRGTQATGLMRSSEWTSTPSAREAGLRLGNEPHPTAAITRFEPGALRRPGRRVKSDVTRGLAPGRSDLGTIIRG